MPQLKSSRYTKNKQIDGRDKSELSINPTLSFKTKPMKGNIKRTPLNPVAHVLIEDVIEVTEEIMHVSSSDIMHDVSMVVDTVQPLSQYVLRLESEEEIYEEPISSTNLLNAYEVSDDAHDSVEADLPLALSASDVLLQIQHGQRTPKTLPRKKAKPVPVVVTDKEVDVPVVIDSTLTEPVVVEPVVLEIVQNEVSTIDDSDAVERVISDLEESLISIQSDEGTDHELSEPLLTLDDLIDDLAIEEDLADLPTEPRRTKKVAAKAKQHRVKLPRTKRKRRKAPTIKRTLPMGWGKMLAGFIGLSFGIVLPLQAMTTFQRVDGAENAIVDQGINGISAITRATHSAAAQDFVQANAEFTRAAHVFGLANDQLNQVNRQLLGIADILPSTGQQVRTVRAMLKSGEASARAAATLTEGLSTISNRSGEHPTNAISLFDVFVENALPDLRIADNELQSISLSAVPLEHRKTVQTAMATTSSLVDSLEIFHESSNAIKALLGDNERQRYLILFQNNTELRPTGGFWGSFAEVDVLDGELVNISVPGGGTYDLQGQLREYVQAPQPLQLVGDRWEFQDANWFPDFPTSAEKAIWFYEKSGGPSVDGIIAVNATWVSKVIEATGPIELETYGKTIDSENFLFETQKQVEVDYDKEENKPKAFIGDMAGTLIERLTTTEGDSFLELATLLSDGLENRDIQIYHTDPEIQSAITNLGWDGGIVGNTGDYFMLVHTNLGGGKTDGVIDDDVEINSRVRDDGRIENNVKITRTHHGLKSSMFSGANNVSFTRIFVPRGSKLISTVGANPPADELFEENDHQADELLTKIESTTIDSNSKTQITESFGKTSFGNWIQTQPGTSSTLEFTYLLPSHILEESPDDWVRKASRLVGIPESVRHTFVVQKQSGVDYRNTRYSFDPGTSLMPTWSSEDTMSQLALDKNQDAFFGILMERK
jgi:hypothetical protein